MASLFERVKNLFDDHQSRDAASELANQRTHTVAETRDALLAKTLGLQQGYRDELAVAAGPGARKEINAIYAARFEGLNDAFTVLRQSEPGVTTKLDVDQFRQDAERHVEHQARLRDYQQAVAQNNHEQARGPYQVGKHSGFSF